MNIEKFVCGRNQWVEALAELLQDEVKERHYNKWRHLEPRIERRECMKLVLSRDIILSYTVSESRYTVYVGIAPTLP